MIIGIKDKTWYCGRLKSQLIIKLTTLSVTMVTHQWSITCYLLQNTTPIKHKSKFHDNHDHVWLSPPKSALLCIKLILFFICLHFFISSSNKSAVSFDTRCLMLSRLFNKPSSQWVLLTKQSSLPYGILLTMQSATTKMKTSR